MSTPRLASLLVLSLVACARPRTVQMAAPPPITAPGPVELPPIRVLDTAGDVMEPQPALDITVFPAGVATVDGTRLTPVGNGTAQVVVKVKGTSAQVAVPVEVVMVDAVELTCLGSRECAVGVGSSLMVQARALAAGAALMGVETVVTATPTDVLAQKDPLRFQGVAPGVATLTARAGGVEVSRRVNVVTVPDRVTLSCPQGFLAHDATQQKPSCQATAGKEFDLLLAMSAHGKPVTGLAVEWSTTDARVASVDQAGHVEARDLGTTQISARVFGTRADLDVSVLGDPEVSVRLGPTCSGNNRVRALVRPYFRRTGELRTTVVMCETRGGARCLEKGFEAAHLSAEALPTLFEQCCCGE
jgi:hypothetical protein